MSQQQRKTPASLLPTPHNPLVSMLTPLLSREFLLLLMGARLQEASIAHHLHKHRVAGIA